jgi:hypothetical protein
MTFCCFHAETEDDIPMIAVLRQLQSTQNPIMHAPSTLVLLLFFLRKFPVHEAVPTVAWLLTKLKAVPSRKEKASAAIHVFVKVHTNRAYKFLK